MAGWTVYRSLVPPVEVRVSVTPLCETGIMSDQSAPEEQPWTATVGGRRVRVAPQADGTFAATYRSGEQLDLSQVPAGTVLVVGSPRPAGPALS
jgi:hypothetical protein